MDQPWNLFPCLRFWDQTMHLILVDSDFEIWDCSISIFHWHFAFLFCFENWALRREKSVESSFRAGNILKWGWNYSNFQVCQLGKQIFSFSWNPMNQQVSLRSKFSYLVKFINNLAHENLKQSQETRAWPQGKVIFCSKSSETSKCLLKVSPMSCICEL